MVKISIDAQSAKSLCTKDEFQIYEQALPDKLDALSAVELRDLVTRSRTVRDKWRDVGRTQRRATQSDRGHRQNAENARSKDKALLFSEVHQIFVDRQKEVEKGAITIPAGRKETKAPRSDRQLTTRSQRAETRDTLKTKKRTMNQSARKNERAVSPSSSDSTAAASPTKKVAKKTAGKKVATKKVAAAKGASKKPVVTKSRKKMLAKRAQAQANPKMADAAKPPGKLDASLTNAQKESRNRPIHGKAVSNRKKVGGMTRVKSHLSSQNKRSQARRDSK